MKNKEAYEIATLFHKWICDSTLRKSPNTVKAYTETMSVFLKYLEEIKSVTLSSFCASKDLTIGNITEWLNWMHNVRGCKPESCNARLASLRSFFKYLGQMDPKYRSIYMESADVTRLKEAKKKVTGMSENAVQAIVAEIDTSTPIGIRDNVFLSLMYGTATRIGEIMSLKLEDVRLDLNKPYIHVKGKGNKDRTIALYPRLVKNVRLYMNIFHAHSDSVDYLFYSRTKGKNYPMSQVGISKRIKMYAVAAKEKCPDVPADIHAHQFRHAKASHLLKDGLRTPQLSKYLGHEQLSTTMVYLDIDMDMKTEAIMKLEDENIKKIKPKWGKGNDKLSSLFK